MITSHLAPDLPRQLETFVHQDKCVPIQEFFLRLTDAPVPSPGTKCWENFGGAWTTIVSLVRSHG